ncbi:hypothetical protein RJ639_040461 [Escallonia herrerae]|uniref:Cytokinin riboside 5'-monophosphate phosphoribohydrolase n=1 Tax=Escallonia herrerae TaxID=1293975 RepID=A0AA89B6J9_9ASTE|nr:hypothetical protein RJ639_040461 [Escallonia herrerae]
MGKLIRVCVYCGSSSGHRKIFSDAALDLGKELVERKMDLIYGGGSIGLMGLVSQTVYDGGCHVLGVIPTSLNPIEEGVTYVYDTQIGEAICCIFIHRNSWVANYQISGHAVGEVMVVSDMHERKAEMARQADAFIALPGGYGTMEELLEMVSWSQLRVHRKPVGLLNIDGYYDCLLRLFDKGVEEGFINPSARDILISAKTPKELIDRMEVTLLSQLFFPTLLYLY